MQPELIADYQQRIDFAQQQTKKQEKLINTYSVWRLAIFLAFLVLVYFSVAYSSVLLFLAATAISSLVFNALVKRQDICERDKTYYKNYEAVSQNELNSITNSSSIYNNGSEFIDEKHYYTADLDIFGKSSLFALLNRTATPGGTQVLAGWLSQPGSRQTILERQQAVAEIAHQNDWRLNLQARLLFALNEDKQQLKKMFTYLRTPVQLGNEQWLLIYTKWVPYLTLTALVLAIFFPAARYVAGLLLAFNNRLVSSKSKQIDKADLIAGKIGENLDHYADAFKEIEEQDWQSEWCVKFASRVKQNSNGSVSGQIRQLSVLVNRLNQRLNMVMDFLLNALFIWNIRQVMAIELWKRNSQPNLEAAFDSLAHFEAVISIASLHINQPQWCLPEIVEGEGYTLTAQGIGHPLIKEGVRVSNDYSLKHAYTIDIITGSNMAGKSTFLRTLGINGVLALCGAPVCATSMQISVMQLFSYMRIKDSLNESTSTFKAELDRLQTLLKATAGNHRIFFLIDEMLRGTNSVDKYLGSKAVIEQLIRQRGVGLVATHDLQLAELEKQYPDYIRNFYFDIQVQGTEMLFDYKIKPGECKTFNASLLLKQIGISLPAEA